MSYDGTLKFDTLIDSGGFQKGISSIGDIAQKGLQATAAILKTSMAAVGGLGAAAIKVGSDFEAGMSQVQAISGASIEELKELTEKAKEMGAATKFSAAESAEAMNYMAMAGWKTADMLNGIEGIMNLAAASGEDLATTSDIVTDAMTAFGMSASETTKIMKDGLTKEVANATHFADILAAASNNANTNVSMLGESFKYVAPVAGALGYSAEDTAIALGLMANAGIKASQGGTALRAILTNMAKPTEDVADAMEYLGLSLQDDEGEMLGFMDVMADMREAFGQCKMPMDVFQEQLAEIDAQYASGELTEKKYNKALEDLIEKAYGAEGALKAKYAATIAGKEGMSGLLAIVNAAPDDFDKLTTAIYDCDGAAERMKETMEDNLQGQLTVLRSGLDILGVSIYEDLQEPLKDVAIEAQNMVRELQNAFNSGGLDGLVSVAGDVLGQIIRRMAEEAPALVETAVQLVISFCEGLKNAPGLGETGASLIAALVTGLLSCAGEIWSTAVVIFTEFLSGLAAQLPQILVTGGEAVAQFGRALVENAPSILASAGVIITTLYDGLMATLPQVAMAGADILNGLAEGITGNLPSMIPVAMEALVQFSGSLRNNVGLLVDAGLNLIMALAQSLIDNIPVFIETVPTIITNIAGIINDNAPKLLTSGIELIAQLALGLLKALPVLAVNLPQIIQAIVSVFTAFNWISLGQHIISFITNGVKSLASSIPTAIKNIGQTAKDWLRGINWRTLGTDIISFITNGIRSLVTSVPNLLKSIGQTAVEWFKGIDWLDLGINVVKGIISGITGALDGLWSAVGDLCSGMLDGVKGFFGIHSPSTVMAEQGDYLVQGLINGIANMPAELAAYLDQTVQKIIAWGQQMFSNVQGVIQNVVNTAVSLIAQLPGKIWTWLVNVVTKVTQWGQQMLSTAKTAISNMISAVINLISQLPGKIWTWLSNVVTKVTQWGHQMLNTAKSAVQRMISAVISLLSELPGKVWTWLVNVVTKVTAWGQQMLNTAKNAISTMISAVISLLSELPGKVWTWLVNTVAKVTQWGQQMISGAKSAISSMVSSVVSLISELPGKVWSWLANTMSKVTDWGRQMVTGARSAISDMLSSVSSHMAQLPGQVAEKLSDAAGRVASWAGDMASRGADAARSLYSAVVDGISGLPGEMASIGSNIINGIWGGISSGWSWLTGKVRGLADSLFQSAKDALGINSPSKVFAQEVGRWIPPGIGVGMEKAMPDLQRQVDAEMASLAGRMQAAVAIETGGITVRAKASADHKAAVEYQKGGGDTYVDQHIEQENNYHVPVATPSEISKSQREAARKLLGGVK